MVCVNEERSADLSVRRVAHYDDPKLEMQVESFRRAASDQALNDHVSRNGGTHGLGPNHVFESTDGAQLKANKALGEAKEYTDFSLASVAYVKAGDTDSRPVEPSKGLMYFDTDLGFPVWYDGTGWVNAMGDDPDL